VKAAITGIALVFTTLMLFATIYVLLTEGPDIFTLFGLIVVALFGLGIFGALSEPTDRRRKR
jgi:hypothetical protein